MNRLFLVTTMIHLFTSISYSKTKSTDRCLSVNVQSKINYAENVHMYICIEAFKLLKDRFPNLDLSQIENRLGTMDDCGTRPWQVGKITTGACREDKEDVFLELRGRSISWQAVHASGTRITVITGDHSLTHLEYLGEFPNAYTKITKFIDGQWFRWSNGYHDGMYIGYLNPLNGLTYRYSYHTRGLINFFKTKRIWFHSYINTLGQEEIVDEERTLDNNTFNKIVWEILGRMAHLLQDLSVPAHNHDDVHLPPPVPNDFDCYHEYIDEGGYLNFNWQSAKINGGFINPYEFANEPVRYLVYSASQLADQYPSGPEHSIIGDINKQIGNDDNVHAEIDSSAFIILEFESPEKKISPGWKREFVFEVNGHYLMNSQNYGAINPLLTEHENNDSRVFSIDQNYPNPFNPLTVINYECKSPGPVKIKVYDILGKEIVTLVNENKKAGIHKTKFDGSNLSNGIYFCRLEVDGSIVFTKKMMLIK